MRATKKIPRAGGIGGESVRGDRGARGDGAGGEQEVIRNFGEELFYIIGAGGLYRLPAPCFCVFSYVDNVVIS